MHTAGRTTELKILTKIRLLIARLTQITVLNPTVRPEFRERTLWRPTMPMIPSEWSRTVGEVRDEADKCFDAGADTVFVPVLMKGTDGSWTIRVAFLSRDPVACDVVENIQDMAPHVTMGELMDTLAPGKRWDYDDIHESRELDALLDLV